MRLNDGTGFKIVRDASGNFTGTYGPNVEGYDPRIATGYTLNLEASAPPLPLTLAKARKHAEVKTEAERRIDLIVDSTRAKLREMMHAVIALEQGLMALDAGQPVPQAVKDTLAPIKATGVQIQVILDAQAAIDAEVDALVAAAQAVLDAGGDARTEIAAVEGYDVAGNPLWP